MSHLRAFLIGLFLSLTAAFALGQTVSPVIVEYTEAGKGKVALTNNTLSPLSVTLKGQSFSISDAGKAVYRQLDPGIHLKLSSTSVKLEPGQTYYVFYTATADKYPAWFTLFATFSGLHHESGLNLEYMLPHTVYLYQKESLQKDDLEVKEVTYDPSTGRVHCEIVNKSDRLGRSQGASFYGSHDDTVYGGFPLLPSAVHGQDYVPETKAAPKEIEIRFKAFNIRHSVSVKGALSADSKK
jgi:hypothetical protein